MFQNLSEKVKTEYWLSNQEPKSRLFFYLLLLFLPTQFGKHFWPDFSFIYGIRVDYLSPTFYFTDLLILLIFIFSIFENFKKIKKINIGTYLTRIVFSLFISSFFILGVVFSKSPSEGFYGILKILEFVFLISYTAKNFRKLNIKLIFSSFFIGILFESILVILQYLNQGSIGGVMYFFGERMFNSETPGIANASINGQLILRPYGTFSHPNVLAAYLFISMYLILILSREIKGKFINVFTLLSLFFGTVGIFLSFSRTGIFTWILSLFLYFIFAFMKKTRIAILKKDNLIQFFVVSVFALLILIFSINIPLVQRFTSLSLSDESVLQRENLAEDSLFIFQKNVFLGSGVNNFLINLPEVEKNLNQSFYLQPVHNIYLLTLAQTGIFGTTLFIFFLSYLFLKIKKFKEFLILYFSILFLGFFDHYFLTLQQGQIIFSVVIGIFLSFPKIPKKMLI